MWNMVHSGLWHWGIYHHMAPKVPNATFLSFALFISVILAPLKQTHSHMPPLFIPPEI